MRRVFVSVAMLALATAVLGKIQPLGHAQQLDLDDLHGNKARPVVVKQPATFRTNPGITLPASSGPSIPSSLPSNGIKPLSATISKTLYLPPAMYGQWSVMGTMLETNVRDSRPVSTNIWVLARDSDRVTITNPDNGATASVNVETVQDNTATFNKIIKMGRLLNSEKVTITVAGDTFYGKNLMQNQYYQDGRLVRTEYALFQLQGTRISGARLQFKPERTQDGPDLEIESLQHR